MSIETGDFNDWADGAHRRLEQKLEQMREEFDQIEKFKRTIDLASQLATEKEKLTAETEKLAAENESLKEQLQEEKRQKAELEMKMNEMSKLSAGMA